MIQKQKLKLIVVVILEIMKLQKKVIFITVLRTLIPTDKETLADIEYQSEKYVSMIRFCYVDKTLLVCFFYRKLFNFSYFY